MGQNELRQPEWRLYPSHARGRSTPPHPPTRKRRHYEFSSSSSDDDEIPPPSALGRRLNLAREGSRLERDCQFVKRAIHDPALQGNVKDKPTYLNIDSAIDKTQMDPRKSQAAYALGGRVITVLEPVAFLWDGNSKGVPPPTTVLVTGFPANVISKALLTNLITVALNHEISDHIKDVQLADGIALLTMDEPAASSQLVSGLRKKDAWSATFDPGGRQFRKITRPKLTEPEPILRKASIDSTENYLKMRCSKRVPCILVDYLDIPKKEGRKDVWDCFRKCRIYNIERGELNWHIHLTSQDELDYALRWKEDFKWNDQTVNFTTKLFTEPARAIDFRKDQPGHSRRESSTNLPMAPHSPLKKEEKRPAFLQKESRGDLDALYGPSSKTVMDISSDSHAAESAAVESTVADELLLNMPIFNKRHLERKRAEEIAAAHAADEMAATQITDEMEMAAARVEEEMVTAHATEEMAAPYTAKETGLALDQKFADEERRIVRKSERDTRKVKKDRDIPSDIVSDNHSYHPDTTSDHYDYHHAYGHAHHVHQAGSAKLEGFYRQSTSEKIVFLENVSAIPRPIYDPSSLQTASSGASRSNRAQNRRLVSSMDSVSSDLYGKATAFSARRKKLILGRSSIHSWGLFSGEEIESGHMVAEYLGEVIRYTVANIREKRYEMALRAKGSTEMASSYFFRLDDNLVVDATHKGNLSRFINHSCDPTCVARVIAIDGAQRIVFYARRDIRLGEEITYDYKFPLEDDPEKKIKCLCGTRSCRGTLN